MKFLKSECIYTSHYCEENVHHLISKFPSSITPHLYTIFISNPSKSVIFWNQSSCQNQDEPVIWDYHVLLLYKSPLNSSRESLIYDLDSKDFPSTLLDYIAKALCVSNFPSRFDRCYRVIPASLYLQCFSSNRSHMKSQEQWLSPPPTYPCIWKENQGHNLESFIDMMENKSSNVFGKVYNESEWLEWLNLSNLK